MLTYGGDPITQGMIALARRRGVPVVFAIHNFAYTEPWAFPDVDYCLVASEFACRYYRDSLGLDCHAVILPGRLGSRSGREPRPAVCHVRQSVPEKGVYAFARIAHELGRRRPDIPLLVVESRGTQRNLAACGLDLAAAGNIQIMAHTTDPRQFWGLTRIALMPSLWWENQPLVAIEAMINGIPVIGSDRGGIPETLGDGRISLPLPERLTPVTRIVPTAEEVEPWVEAIIRLWDDRDSTTSRARGFAGSPALASRPATAALRGVFRNVRPQPGPPYRFPRRAGSCDGEHEQPCGKYEVRRTLASIRGRHRDKPRTFRRVHPLSFVACVSDDSLLKANLLASPFSSVLARRTRSS